MRHDHRIDSLELDEFGAECSRSVKDCRFRGVKCAGSTNPYNERQLCGATYGHAENALISLVSSHFDIFLNENKTKREERMEKGKKLDGRGSFK